MITVKQAIDDAHDALITEVMANRHNDDEWEAYFNRAVHVGSMHGVSLRLCDLVKDSSAIKSIKNEFGNVKLAEEIRLIEDDRSSTLKEHVAIQNCQYRATTILPRKLSYWLSERRVLHDAVAYHDVDRSIVVCRIGNYARGFAEVNKQTPEMKCSLQSMKPVKVAPLA